MMMASKKKKMIPPVLPEEFRRVESTGRILKEFKYREERVTETVLEEIAAEEEDYSHLVFSAVKFVNFAVRTALGLFAEMEAVPVTWTCRPSRPQST